MNYLEKRQSERKKARNTSVSLRPLDPQIWFKFWGGTECLMRDISQVGIGIYCKEELPVGTRLSIDLRLGKKTSDIRIFGRIAWLVKEKNKYRAGVSFAWWKDDQDRKTVDNFVEKLALVN